jgi:hypothetical protein
MASDPTLIYMKAGAVDQLLKRLPADCPSWREASIQNAKLHRMIPKMPAKHQVVKELHKAARKKHGGGRAQAPPAV